MFGLRWLWLVSLASVAGCSLLFANESSDVGDGGITDARTAVGACDLLPTGWRHYVTIEIPGIAGAEGNVPIPIRISAQEFSTLGLPESPASLRLLINQDDALRHEVESWQPTGESVVWVLLPQMPPLGQSAYMEMFFENPGAPRIEDPNGLWTSAGYSAVWHMGGTIARNSMTDSGDGQLFGDITPYTLGDSVGEAFVFGGSGNDYIEVPDNASQQAGLGDDNFTIEARIRRSAPGDDVSRWIVNKPNSYFLYSSRENVAGGDKSQGQLFLVGSQALTSHQLLGTGVWQDLAMIVSITSAKMSYSIDGIAVGDTTDVSAARLTSNQPLLIGPSFAGSIDELRISKLARGGNWQVLQHALLDSNASILGPLQTCSAK